MSLIVCRLIGGMEIRARLSLNMRRLRQSKGWSQEEFAHKAGLHRTYVSDLERGARNPTVTVVDKLAVALDVKVGVLLDSQEAS
jgi:transcriptional regulator with XRE-family HTH domain